MSEIVADPPDLPVISCFPDPESSNFNRLILITRCIARAGVSPREAPATRAAGRAASLICCGRSALNYCRRRSLPPTPRRPGGARGSGGRWRGGNCAGGGLFGFSRWQDGAFFAIISGTGGRDSRAFGARD
jgi:hypothetical protein